MSRTPGTVDAVKQYLQRKIDRRSTEIARARTSGTGKGRRQKQGGATAADPAMVERRAYQDALRVLNAVTSDGLTSAALRLAAEEVERVKSALAHIYEVSQHPNHDLGDAGDWAIVEGESQNALNVVHEAERRP